MASSIEQKRAFIAANLFAGGGPAGPYPSSDAAFRAAVLNNVLVPRQQPGGQLVVEPSAWNPPNLGPVVYAPIAPNVIGRYTAFRVEAERSTLGQVLGAPYAWDTVGDQQWGSTVVDVPAREGKRMNGFDRPLGSANTTDATRRAVGPVGTSDAAWSPADDALTWSGRCTTRAGSGAGGIFRIAPEGVWNGGIDGLAMLTNDMSVIIRLYANGGSVIGALNVSGLANGTVYRWVFGLSRNSPGSNSFTARLRVYDEAGTTLINSNSIASPTGYGPGQLADAAMAVLDTTDWLVYRGVDHTLVPATADAIAADAASAGPGIDPGGTLDLRIAGIRTGMYDPSDLSRLLLNDGNPQPDVIADLIRPLP